MLWQQLQHPYVLPFLGIDAESFPSFLCMVSPWMVHGTILKHLAEHGNANVQRRVSLPGPDYNTLVLKVDSKAVRDCTRSCISPLSEYSPWGPAWGMSPSAHTGYAKCERFRRAE
jgi:hypothetical protein